MASKAKPRAAGQHHGDLRRALLDAANELLLAGGPAALSLREVARQAGVSPAAPYHHFPDKAALLGALGTEGFRRLELAQERALAGVEDPDERLAQMVIAYLRFAAEHAAHYQLMFPARLGDGDPRLGQVAIWSLQRLFAAIAALRPELAHDQVMFVGSSIWAMSHGWVRLEIDGLLGAEGPLPGLAAMTEQIGRFAVQVARTAGPGVQPGSKPGTAGPRPRAKPRRA